jgi:hypothetical protein
MHTLLTTFQFSEKEERNTVILYLKYCMHENISEGQFRLHFDCKLEISVWGSSRSKINKNTDLHCLVSDIAVGKFSFGRQWINLWLQLLHLNFLRSLT